MSAFVVQDGNLAPIEKLVRLRNLSFADRAHYSHKLAAFLAMQGDGAA